MYRGVVTGEGRDKLEGKYKLDEYIALRRVVCGLVVVVSFEGEFVGLMSPRKIPNILYYFKVTKYSGSSSY